MLRILKRTYDWVLHWAHTPYGAPALAALSFVESSFFPIPPDPLLMALCLGRPEKSFRFAFFCTVFSVLGGILGYAIGLFLMESIGFRILDIYGAMEKYKIIQGYYMEYDAWAVGIAGFTPLPYKVFTIAAGAFEINFAVFVAASLFSRGARFFIIAALLKRYGAGIKVFIDKYFNILTIAFTILLIGGFLLLKMML